MQGFLRELELLIRSRHPALLVVTHEEGRLEEILFDLGRRLGKKLFGWTRHRGLYEFLGHHEPGKGMPRLREPEAVLAEVHRIPEPSLFLLKDFHLFLDRPPVARQLRDLATDLRFTPKTLVLSAPTLSLPPELEKAVTVLDLPLPGREELRALLDALCTRLEQTHPSVVRLDPATADAMVEAALGLTLLEAENAFSKAAVSRGVLDASDVALVAGEKQQTIRKNGILELVTPGTGLSEVGGLEALKAWLGRRGRAFLPEARRFGLPAPRGLLLLGFPGCGKSLTARAVAQAWSLPLLRLDLGRVFEGYIGSSEANMRRALRVAEAVAPAVLWIDEIEKGLAGGTSRGESDAGTAMRVFGTLLTWMQERRGSVFVVATANRVEALPPELLRRGRFDETFFVDLPDRRARAEILRIHLARRGRDPEKFDLAGLAGASAGYSGAELEHCVVEGLFRAFEAGRELADEDLFAALAETTPLSVTSAEEVAALRSWASTRARPAGGVESGGRRGALVRAGLSGPAGRDGGFAFGLEDGDAD